VAPLSPSKLKEAEGFDLKLQPLLISREGRRKMNAWLFSWLVIDSQTSINNGRIQDEQTLTAAQPATI
jgi:hypothetical protein